MLRVVFTLLSFGMGFAPHCDSQGADPGVKIYAYEREVVGGVPGGPPGGGKGAAHLRYVIYLETPPSATFVVDDVWIRGTPYTVETAVRSTPVRFEAPVKLADDAQSIAVPATSNTVTEVVPKSAAHADRPLDASTRKAVDENEVVVRLTFAAKQMLIPMKKLARGAPLYLR